MNLTAYLTRRRARRTHNRAASAATDIHTQLHTTPDPATRAFLLDNLAALEHCMANTRTIAFGPEPPLDDGREMADSIRDSAELMRMVAATERGAAAEMPGCDPREFGDLDGAELELWGRLARTRDHAARADLMDAIWPFAAERVGGQAAEWLACHEQTERELAAAEADGRAPRAAKVRKASPVLIPVAGVGTAFVAALLAAHLFGQGWLW